MNRPSAFVLILLTSIISCKPEHPDLKTAYDLFKDSQLIKQNMITGQADLNNQAKMVDSKIRNEDKESVFAISEVYNHLEAVDAGMKALNGRDRAVPGHEKESQEIPVADPKLSPSLVLMMQKNYRDSLLIIKNDLDAAATLLNHLKTKFN
ncbi:MAG: hypothetical protein ABI844_04335 [Saprospiraceae bacterium]